MITRRTITAGISAATVSLLSSCGTIIYPDRVNQEDRGNLDPLVIILDGVGLFFFIIPGVIAFAVDFTTGAIYLPPDKEAGDKERTIFDDLSQYSAPGGILTPKKIEHVIHRATGLEIDLFNDEVRVARLDHLNEFWMAHTQLSARAQRPA